jgi:hypothetical protein
MQREPIEYVFLPAWYEDDVPIEGCDRLRTADGSIGATLRTGTERKEKT